MKRNLQVLKKEMSYSSDYNTLSEIIPVHKVCSLKGVLLIPYGRDEAYVNMSHKKDPALSKVLLECFFLSLKNPSFFSVINLIITILFFRLTFLL